MNNYFIKTAMLLLFCTTVVIACDRKDSPEGRMSIKLESQKEIMDNLQRQNKAILDTLRMIREDIKMLQQQKK